MAVHDHRKVTNSRRERRRAGRRRAVDRMGRLLWPPTRLVLIPLLLVALLATFAASVEPAWSAKLGGGVHGTFTAESCLPRKGGGCDWQGSFVSSDGRDFRAGVGLGSGNSVNHVGQQVAALDTGDWATVYPAGGGSEWILDTIFLLLTLAALGYWSVKVPVAALRNRRRDTAARGHDDPRAPSPADA